MQLLTPPIFPVLSAAPSSPADGTIYIDSTLGALRARIAGAWVTLGEGGGEAPTLPPVQSNEWVLSWGSNNISSSIGINQNVLVCMKVFLPADTYDNLGCYVTTAGSAGSLIRMGLYTVDTDGSLGALVVDAGTVTAVGTGAKSISFTPTALGGWYWVVWVHNSTTAVSIASGDTRSSGTLIGQSGMNTTAVSYHEASFTFAALPSTPPAIAPTTWTNNAPRLGVQKQ